MPFEGSLKSDCLTEPIVQPLLTLIDVQLEGSNSITDMSQNDKALIAFRIRVACRISQPICSNALKRAPQKDSTPNLYQSRNRETPFPLYVGLKLHVNDHQKGTSTPFMPWEYRFHTKE